VRRLRAKPGGPRHDECGVQRLKWGKREGVFCDVFGVPLTLTGGRWWGALLIKVDTSYGVGSSARIDRERRRRERATASKEKEGAYNIKLKGARNGKTEITHTHVRNFS